MLIPLPVTNGFAQWSFGGFKELGDFGVLELKGDLRKGGGIIAHVKDERISTKDHAALAEGVTELPLKWDFKINTVIY